MDGGQRQQRRNRHRIGAHLAVGDDEDVVALQDETFGLGAQRSEPRFHPLAPPRRRVADVQFGGAELVVRVARDVANLRHVGEVEHRLRHFEAERRVDFVDFEQIGLRPDEGNQRHHQLFAYRVDGRVGHLREQLAEIVEQRLLFIGEHRQGRVVAHRAGGFLAVPAHRFEDELDVFLREAERLLTVEQAGGGLRRLRRRAFESVELDVDFLQPIAVGLGARQGILDFLVVDDAPLVHVDEEHLARLQAPLLDDFAVGNRQHARFGSHDDEIVVGDEIARRTQPVAVEGGADLPPVGERHRGGAVPRLHHRGVVFVEIAPARVHLLVRFPRFGNHHQQRVRHRIAAHHQQFERVVEGGGVGLPRINQRPNLAQVVAEQGRGDALFARAHPVVVAAHGVDFAVVGDVAERLRQIPLRESVGGEALMHQRQRRDGARVGEVGVIDAHLRREQQPLVADGARRERSGVIRLAVLELQRPDGVGGAAARHVELAFQRLGHHHVRPAPDEQLANHRLGGLHRRRHRHGAVDRHVAPAEDDLSFVAHGAFEFFLTGEPGGRFLRQKDHGDAVLAFRRQGDAEFGHVLAVERIGNLNQDARAVALQGVGAHRAAVVDVFQDFQPLQDDVVRLLALDMGDEAHATGVVFVCRVVESLFPREIHLFRPRSIFCRPNAGKFRAAFAARLPLRPRRADTKKPGALGAPAVWPSWLPEPLERERRIYPRQPRGSRSFAVR